MKWQLQSSFSPLFWQSLEYQFLLVDLGSIRPGWEFTFPRVLKLFSSVQLHLMSHSFRLVTGWCTYTNWKLWVIHRHEWRRSSARINQLKQRTFCTGCSGCKYVSLAGRIHSSHLLGKWFIKLDQVSFNISAGSLIGFSHCSCKIQLIWFPFGLLGLLMKEHRRSSGHAERPECKPGCSAVIDDSITC